MKIRVIFALLVFPGILSTQVFGRTPQAASSQAAGGPGQSATGTGANPADTPKIDPAKEASIRQLLEITGGQNRVNEIMDGMVKNMRPIMTNAFPPGEYRDKLIDLYFEKFRSKADIHQLLEFSIQIYDKYLSEEDIKGLIQFYSTPLGKKALQVLPKLSIELQGEGMKWGQNLGRQAMIEVLSEHPELEKAMEEARKNAHPQ
jgi:uncharacterized protein